MTLSPARPSKARDAGPSLSPALPQTPALVVGTVRHTRHTPFDRSFSHDHYQWLVDLDALPDFGLLGRLCAGFDALDHLDGGRLGGGIRGDLTRFLRHRGVDLEPGDRAFMLAHARILGHAFDPLTVFWCVRPDRTLAAVVFEVHNTYGERHAYLLEPDDAGHAEVAKEFYVSPFNDVSGDYRIRLSVTEDRIVVSIVLHRERQRVFTAVTHGRAVPATRRSVLHTVLTHPLLTHRVSFLIRLHGIRLWLARLPIQTRTKHPKESVR
ncbi:MAG: DUF1365 domain-containing protein [Nocardioidaceae bacterium]